MSEKFRQTKTEIESRVKSGLRYVWDQIHLPHTLTPEEESDLNDLNENSTSDLDKEVNSRFANYTPATEPRSLTLLEKFGGMGTKGLVEGPFYNLDNREKTFETMKNYETCVIEERFFDAKQVVWLNFSGLGDGANERSINHPTRQMCPREGVQINFEGPTGIAAMNAEQCIRCTEMVMEQVRDLLEKYPNYKIRCFGYSAGTHLATYVANTLGRERGESIDKLILVATGQSIFFGSHSTPITQMIAETHMNADEDKYTLTDKILKYTQKFNTEFLPIGDNTIIIGGDNDRFIPFHAEGGTADQIKMQQIYNPDVGVCMIPGRDHVSIVLYINKLQRQRKDIFNIANTSTELDYEELPPYLKEKLITVNNSSNDIHEPNALVDDTQALIRSDFSQQTTNGDIEALHGAIQMVERRRLVDSNGKVIFNPDYTGYVISKRVVVSDDEDIFKAVDFIQKYGPRNH